jgi:hypothetical protein
MNTNIIDLINQQKNKTELFEQFFQILQARIAEKELELKKFKAIFLKYKQIKQKLYKNNKTA